MLLAVALSRGLCSASRAETAAEGRAGRAHFCRCPGRSAQPGVPQVALRRRGLAERNSLGGLRRLASEEVHLGSRGLLRCGQ